MKTVAVIPCHNEAAHIAGVVTKAKKHVDHVLVVNDGSTDYTTRAASVAGAYVRTLEENHGAGFAVSTGIKLAVDTLKPDIIVILDGDGQHDPEEIPNLVECLNNKYYDTAMGIRIKGAMPNYRRFGNKMLSGICNIGCRFSPPDALTGFWAIKANAIPELTEKKWGWAIELLIKSRNKYRLTEIPVKAIYHNRYSDNSATSPVWLGLVLLWMIIKWRFKVEVLRQ